MNDLVQIVERLEPALGKADSGPVPLDGGITNRNFRLRMGGTGYVIRVPGKETNLLGIDREAERVANDCAADIGIAPPVAAMLTDPPCLVTEFVEGSEMGADDLRKPDVIRRVAGALRRFHDCGRTLRTEFDSFAVVDSYQETARERGVEPPSEFAGARRQAERIRESLAGGEHAPVPCHNDLLAANFIEGEGGKIWLVDWEYAGMGDRYFDLGNFAVNNELDESGEEALLEAYFDEPPSQRRLAGLRLMRFMSDFREAMWGVVQSAVSEIDFDFGEYAAKHFARLEAAAADPSFDQRLEQAAG